MKIKEQFKGSIIRRDGISFDTNKVVPSQYDYYALIGFKDLFEEEIIEPIIEDKQDEDESNTH